MREDVPALMLAGDHEWQRLSESTVDARMRKKMTVRATKIEIYGFGKVSGYRDRWTDLARDVQRIKNRLWQIWLVHHATRGTSERMRAWLNVEKSERGAAPAKPLEAPLITSASAGSFYRIIAKEFPQVNKRTAGLVTQAWQSLLNKRKAASGNLSGWLSILFGNESLPSFNRPQPIPFDKENAKLSRDGEAYRLELRIERLADSGKSVVEDCVLVLGKRKTLSQRRIVDRIIAGEYAWKGSNLCYDRGKWYAMICYEMPPTKHPDLDKGRILFVRPGRKMPWRLRVAGRAQAFGGNGAHVEYARRAILRERFGRQEHNRWGNSKTKGHGGKRARGIWTKLSSRWHDFTKRYNNEVTTRLTRYAVRNGCGRIIYLPPRTDAVRDVRYLSVAGNDARSAMSWDYFSFGALLAYKCEHLGIEHGKRATAKAGARKPPRKSKSDKGVRGGCDSDPQKRK